MNLTDQRTRLRIAARNAQDQTVYTNVQLDDALSRLQARFLRTTSLVKVSATIDLVAESNSASFSALDGFLPSRIERARIDIDDNYTDIRHSLDRVDVDTVGDALNRCPYTGTPEMLAFTDTVTATFFPAPSNDGTLHVRYAQLFIPFTLGQMGNWSASTTYVPGDLVIGGDSNLYRAIITSTNVAVSTTASWAFLGAAGESNDPAGVLSALPDAIMVELIGTGGAAALQSVDVSKQQFAGPAWTNYLDFEKSCMGIGSVGGNYHRREPIRGRRA